MRISIKTLALGTAGLAILGAGSAYLQAARPQQAAPATAPAPAELAAVVNKYCVACHSDKARTGGLTLEKIDVTHPVEGAETWEKVIRKLRVGAMPPMGMPR